MKINNKRTILFIEAGDSGGGSFESMYQMIAALDRRRFKPIVIYLNHTDYIHKMKELQVETVLIRDLLFSHVLPTILVKIFVRIGWIVSLYAPRITTFYEWIIHFNAVKFIRKVVREKNVNLVVLNDTLIRNFFCVVALNKFEVPIIAYLRSFITKGINNYIAEYGNRRVSKYLTYSEGLKDLWSLKGIDENNIEVIPNGIKIVDVEPVDVWARMKITVRNGPLVGCVGSIRPNRSYDFLIRAFSRVIKEEPEAYLAIIGGCHDYKLSNKLKRLASELELTDSITFHGPDPEAKRMIAGMDIFCLPYRIEPFGRVLLEAWLAKTPVIATKKGKIQKIITEHKDGLLVDYGNEKALSESIVRLWRDKELSSSLVQEGRRTVEKWFSIEKCTRKTEELFDRIIDEYRS